MKITIQFEAQLREISGEAEVILDPPDSATLPEVLTLVSEAKDALRERLFSGSEVSPSLMVFVNEQPVTVDHVLHDGDTVLLLPPISGG